jgi:hypothetical protein
LFLGMEKGFALRRRRRRRIATDSRLESRDAPVVAYERSQKNLDNDNVLLLKWI